MAEFCKQCHKDLLGDELENDFAGLVSKGETIAVLCEGCGPTVVNSEGKCLDEGCFKKHGASNHD